MYFLATITSFFGAFLLFLIEPMAAKYLLPILGGAPAVWATCMMFFQITLLIGYLYAGLIGERLNHLRRALHCLLMLAAGFFLFNGPLGTSSLSQLSPITWVLVWLCANVGFCFLMLGTCAPLLQLCIARSNLPNASDPYHLYAASNFGSLLALLGYPFVIERLLPLTAQFTFFQIAYFIFCGLLTFTLLKTKGTRSPLTRPARTTPFPSKTACLRWITSAMLPSILLLGVTTNVTTDIAAIPLLWIIPLALYLITFILAYMKSPIVPVATISRFLPMGMCVLSPLLVYDFNTRPLFGAAGQFLLFFLAALFCHSDLAARRPTVDHLGIYYFCLALGGAFGGFFNVIIAPLVFSSSIEFPLALGIVLFIRAEHLSLPKIIKPLFFLCAYLILVGLLLSAHLFTMPLGFILLLTYGIPVIAWYHFRNTPTLYAIGFCAIYTLLFLIPLHDQSQSIVTKRNFFGIKKIVFEGQAQRRVLYHGGTIHGSQNVSPILHRVPTTYYHRSGPIGDVFHIFENKNLDGKIGVVGLGIGTMACYSKPGEQFTFYELDPEIAQIAQDPSLFTFLADSPGIFEIIFGDGRLSLTQVPDKKFHLLILDVFSSDAIPVHLLTKEALSLYLSKVDEGGIVVFHISNRYLTLEPILANIALALGAQAIIREDVSISKEQLAQGKSASAYAVLSKSSDSLAPLLSLPEWRHAKPSATTGLWTDDYTNIFSVLHF